MPLELLPPELFTELEEVEDLRAFIWAKVGTDEVVDCYYIY